MSTCTRPGKHGLQHLFAIPYGDRGYGERDHVIGRWRTWAYDADDALERFYEDNEGDFHVLGAATRVKCSPGSGR